MDINLGKIKHQFINCQDMTVAGSCEAQNNERVEAYFPASCLTYVERGIMNIEHENQVYQFPKGSFCFVRKYTQAAYFKTFTPEEGFAQTYTFALSNEFLRKVVKDFHFEKNLKPVEKRVIHLEPNLLLKSVMSSVKSYLEEGQSLEPDVLELKTKEALMAIVKSDRNLAVLFKEYARTERADLAQFINHNYLYNFPLSEFARQSGRSLSTFNREFKNIFGTTPHKWIHKKRLARAREILKNSNRKVSDVYLEVGFEDLAHFSKSFKKEFGINPSKVRILPFDT